MHTKDAKNKKIKIFKFSLALYQISFRMYSGLCKKNLVLVGSKCTILELSFQLYIDNKSLLFYFFLFYLKISFASIIVKYKLTQI